MVRSSCAQGRFSKSWDSWLDSGKVTIGSTSLHSCDHQGALPSPLMCARHTLPAVSSGGNACLWFELTEKFGKAILTLANLRDLTKAAKAL